MPLILPAPSRRGARHGVRLVWTPRSVAYAPNRLLKPAGAEYPPGDAFACSVAAVARQFDRRLRLRDARQAPPASGAAK
jgi:hypothetical protein